MRRVSPVVLLLLLSACAPTARTYGRGPNVSNDMMPPARTAEAQVPLWDHFCTELGVRGADDLARLLETASAHGWEMAGASSGIFCFKRPHRLSTATGPRRFACEVVGTLDQGEAALPGSPERLLYPE